MFGKPIAQAGLADLHRLKADGVPEGRHLEFKKDIPVSPEERARQRKANSTATPVDRTWVSSNGLMAFGRDALIEELVAFANADGGVIVLGLEQTATEPARAGDINALPDVAKLERSNSSPATGTGSMPTARPTAFLTS
jgi:hypothetical protein